MEGAATDVVNHDPNGWDHRCDDRTDGDGDLRIVELCPCPGVLDTCNGGVAGFTVAFNV